MHNPRSLCNSSDSLLFNIHRKSLQQLHKLSALLLFQGICLQVGVNVQPAQHHGDHGDAAQNEPGGGVGQGTQMAAADGKGYKAAAPHGGGKHQKDGAAGLFIHKHTLPFLETGGLITKTHRRLMNRMLIFLRK